MPPKVARTGGGSKPLVNENRLAYFPFLRRLKAPTHTTDLLINYDSAYKEKRCSNWRR